MKRLNFTPSGLYLFVRPRPVFQQCPPEHRLPSPQYTYSAPEVWGVEPPEHTVPFDTSVPLHSHCPHPIQCV